MTLTIMSSCLCSETWQRRCRLAWRLWPQVSTLSLPSWQWPFPSCPLVCVQKLGRDGADLWPQMFTLSLPSWQWPFPSCLLVCVQKLVRDGADLPGDCGHRCLHYHYHHGNDLTIMSSCLCSETKQRWHTHAAAPSTWPMPWSTPRTAPPLLYPTEGRRPFTSRPPRRWRDRSGSRPWSWPSQRPSKCWKLVGGVWVCVGLGVDGCLCGCLRVGDSWSGAG